MKELKLDHIIHYIQQLNDFKYPGHILKLNQGGQHERLGTFNRLAYLNNAYIELLDVNKPEVLQKIIKTEEGRVSFPSKIVQDDYKQGLKTIAFQTSDIDQVKSDLEEKGVEVIGPVNMQRENKKGHKTTWRLLYIADPDYRVKPPFFIQWDEIEEVRNKKIEPFKQKEFTVKGIVINSTERAHTVEKWCKWFNMKIVDETATYSDLKFENDPIIYRINDGHYSGYKTIQLTDNKTTSSYTLIIRGANYQFEAD